MVNSTEHRSISSLLNRKWSHSNTLLLLSILLSSTSTNNKSGIFGGVQPVEAGSRRYNQQEENRKRQNQQQQQYGGYGGGMPNYGGFGGGMPNFDQQQYAQAQQQWAQQAQQQQSDPNGFYSALDIPNNASAKDVKSAYRKLALKYHPDKFQPNPNYSEAKNEKLKERHNDRFVKVSAAYDVLSDEKKRNAYDKYGQNGLDMLEKGIDPEEAGFGQGFGGFGGFPGGGFPGGTSFDGGDAFKMFEQMFGGNMGGGGGFSGGGMPNMGGFSGGGMPNMDDILGGMGMGGFGGMGGGGGGRGGGRQQQRQQQKPQRRGPPVQKDDPSGVAPLGKSKFPDANSKHAWLVLFYDKNKFDESDKTKQYVTQSKQLSEQLLKKAKNNKDAMTFKVGAIDCSGAALNFCKSKLGKGVEIPSFATVLNGSVDAVTDSSDLRSAKALHEHTTNMMIGTEGLIINVNSIHHIKQRLLNASPTPGHPSVAIMLFSEKYETSPLYASLAYRHRQDGFAAFGESRGKNQQLASQYGVKKYPLLVALIGNQKVEPYNGALDGDSISKWLNGVAKKHFKSQSRKNDNKKRSGRR